MSLVIMPGIISVKENKRTNNFVYFPLNGVYIGGLCLSGSAGVQLGDGRV